MPVLDFSERLAAREAIPRGWLAAPEDAGRGEANALVQDLAHELAPGAEAVASDLARRLLAGEERLVDPEDPTVASLAERFVHTTVGAMLSSLAYGLPIDAARPTEASIALFERMAERDEGLAVVLRSHRILTAELWQAWAAFTDERVCDRAVHRSVLSTSHRQLAAYTDCVCEYLTCLWPEMRGRRRRGVAVPIEELVRRAVFGSPAAATAALVRLAYPVEAFHLAVALPSCVERDELEDLARRLRLACGAPTLAVADANGMNIWIAFPRAAAAAVVERAWSLIDFEAPVGMGDVCAGLEGFRRTRQQSADALRMGGLRGATGITGYRDIALLAVLCADESRARELARVELGRLAGDDEVATRLRDTVRAYLAAGESQTAAAKRLFIHEKTVKYRLRQAEEMLGCQISDRRSELGAALMVHLAFDGRL